MQAWQSKMQKFDRWLHSTQGQRLLKSEWPILQNYLDEFTCLTAKEQLLLYFPEHHRNLKFHYQQVIRVGIDLSKNTDLVAAPFALPFSEESFDTIILPYVLECCCESELILKEAYRILKPEGILILVNLNPNLLAWRFSHQDLFKQLNYYSRDKLYPELFLQGYDLLKRDQWGFPNTAKPKPWLEKLGRIAWPFLAKAYSTVLRKRLDNVTLIKSTVSWQEAVPLHPQLANCTKRTFSEDH